MRRNDREIKDKTIIESIINEALVCRIGLSENNIPYIIPMNFGYRDNYLFLHSAKEGRKIDMIRNNNNVCFEIDISHEIIKSQKACDWGMNFRSIVGFGKAFLLGDITEKRNALDIIMRKYSGMNLSFEYPGNAIDQIAIIKIEIKSITGKKCGY